MKAIIAKNSINVIGLNGELPWKSKEDLKHFKKLTMGCKLLVGYTTAQKLPQLKGREIVIDDETKAINYNEIDWCCGGKYTYEKFCHLFTELHISVIDDDTIGDTMFPELKNLNPDCKIYTYNFKKDKKDKKVKKVTFEISMDAECGEDGNVSDETLFAIRAMIAYSIQGYTVPKVKEIIGDLEIKMQTPIDKVKIC